MLLRGLASFFMLFGKGLGMLKQIAKIGSNKFIIYIDKAAKLGVSW